MISYLLFLFVVLESSASEAETKVAVSQAETAPAFPPPPFMDISKLNTDKEYPCELYRDNGSRFLYKPTFNYREGKIEGVMVLGFGRYKLVSAPLVGINLDREKIRNINYLINRKQSRLPLTEEELKLTEDWNVFHVAMSGTLYSLLQYYIPAQGAVVRFKDGKAHILLGSPDGVTKHVGNLSYDVTHDGWGKMYNADFIYPYEEVKCRAVDKFYRRVVKIDRVIDGDTAVFITDLGYGMMAKVKVRFDRVQAPELEGESSKEGYRIKRLLENRLKQCEEIQIRARYLDKYSRWLGEVYCWNNKEDKMPQNINDWLLDNRYAKLYTPYRPHRDGNIPIEHRGRFGVVTNIGTDWVTEEIVSAYKTYIMEPDYSTDNNN